MPFCGYKFYFFADTKFRILYIQLHYSSKNSCPNFLVFYLRDLFTSRWGNSFFFCLSIIGMGVSPCDLSSSPWGMLVQSVRIVRGSNCADSHNIHLIKAISYTGHWRFITDRLSIQRYGSIKLISRSFSIE